METKNGDYRQKPMEFMRIVKPTTPTRMVNQNLRGDVFHIHFRVYAGIEQRTTRKQVVKPVICASNSREQQTKERRIRI